jgi:Mg/Co/Ni transporter MgtE
VAARLAYACETRPHQVNEVPMTSENAGNVDRIRDALDQGDLEEATAYLRTLPAADIAELIVHLPDPIRASALEGLSASDVSEVLEYLLPRGPEVY